MFKVVGAIRRMSDLCCILNVLEQCNLPAELINVLRDNYKIRYCEPDDVIFQQEEYWNSVIIVKKGLLRFYYMHEKGVEVNKYFLREGEFMAPVWDENTSFNFALSSMEESVILIISLDLLKNILGKVNVEYIQRFENNILKKIVLKKIDREMSQILMSAAERYDYVLRTMPEIAKRIPQYHLASYLGITPVSLSRIKSAYSK